MTEYLWQVSDSNGEGVLDFLAYFCEEIYRNLALVENHGLESRFGGFVVAGVSESFDNSSEGLYVYFQNDNICIFFLFYISISKMIIYSLAKS